MTFEEFREKLIPIFTPQEIGKLDRQAIWDALDAFGTNGKIKAEYGLTKWEHFCTLHYMGRDFIIHLIYDVAADGPEEFKRYFDISLSPERMKKLMEITEEW